MFLVSPYRAVLRVPYARAAFAASLAGRLCYGIVSLSLILNTLTAAWAGHYGFAGFVMALFGLTIVLVSPLRAALIDRLGPRLAVPPMAAGFAARPGGHRAVILGKAVQAPGDAAIAMLAAAAYACAPPLGVGMRSWWSSLIDDRSLLQSAYSLDGVVEALLYVAGPAIAGVITIVAQPAIGLLVTAGLAVTGTGLFLRSPALARRTATPATCRQEPGTRLPRRRAVAALSWRWRSRPARSGCAWAGSAWSSSRSARPGTTPRPWRGSRRGCRRAARSAASATGR